MTAEELYKTAKQAYPYITFSIEVVKQFLNQGFEPDEWLLYDYILSQDLAEDIEL